MTSLSKKVIEWWYSLTKDKQQLLIQKYYPNTDFIHISSISSKLEEIYYKEKDESISN